MHVAGHPLNLLTTAEIELIIQSALRVLAEMGMEIENERLLRALAEFGLPVDFAAQRVRFPAPIVERFIAEAEKFDWAAAKPGVRGSAGVYHGLYHDPLSNQLVPWTEDALAFYFSLPGRLDNIGGQAGMLGSRLPGPAPLEPLYERYYCWKYGAHESGTIHLDELCPFVLELYQALADERGAGLAEVFRGTVYLVPPLKLGRHEAYQVAYFLDRGLRVGIGDMYLMGATAPATMAGAVTLNLAEQLALRILSWALFGVKRLHVGCSLGAMDMRTMIYPYGRPEVAVTNLMTIQVCRHLGASFSGHAGGSDAKLPSVEVGAQRALTAVPTLLAGGSVGIPAGLLSIDEVCSPIQMVLDNELVGALRHYVREFEVSEEAIGLETILEAGPGGQYLDTLQTARTFRHEHWQPTLWSQTMVAAWLDGDRRLDVDKAREIVLDLQAHTTRAPGMSDSLEREVQRIIGAAGKALRV